MRDNLDVSAFHIAVPQGVSAIDVDFQYLSPTAANQGRIVATPDLASIQWIANSMYPAGYYRPRHSDPGVGDRSDRMACRDRASPKRAERAIASIIRSRATRS